MALSDSWNRGFEMSLRCSRFPLTRASLGRKTWEEKVGGWVKVYGEEEMGGGAVGGCGSVFG